MVITNARSRRKPTGGLYRSSFTKRKHMIGRPAAMTRAGEAIRTKQVRAKGGGRKNRLLETNMANVLDPKSGKHAQLAITGVAENPANRNFVRRNILTRGTIITTENGKARVTSRPGQDGQVTAILVE